MNNVESLSSKRKYVQKLKDEGYDVESRAALNDRRYQETVDRITALEDKIGDIEKTLSNDLHHLTLDNMPDVKEMLEGLYRNNKVLVGQVEYLTDTLRRLKILITVTMSLSTLSLIYKLLWN